MDWKEIATRGSKGLSGIEDEDIDFLKDIGFKESDDFESNLTYTYSYINSDIRDSAYNYFDNIKTFLKTEGTVKGDDAVAYIAFGMIYLEWEPYDDEYEGALWEDFDDYEEFEEALGELFTKFKLD